MIKKRKNIIEMTNSRNVLSGKFYISRTKYFSKLIKNNIMKHNRELTRPKKLILQISQVYIKILAYLSIVVNTEFITLKDRKVSRTMEAL